jgi:hypothetical protein
MDEKYHPKNFGFVYVSNSVILDRRWVTAMFRKDPEPNIPFSGWCFICDERGNPKDIDLHSVEILLAADPSVAPFLDAPIGSSFVRLEGGNFQPDTEEDEHEPTAL